MVPKIKERKRIGLIKAKMKLLWDDYFFNYHEKIYRDNLAKMVQNLDNDHPVKILLGEHKKISHALSLLEKTLSKFQKCNKFECITVGQWQLLNQSVGNFKKIDQLFSDEEKLLFPELTEHGFSAEIRQIIVDHTEIHDLIDRLGIAYDDGIRDNYREISSAINAISLNLAEKIRTLIHRESYILYPRALRVISGQNSWQRLREIAETMQIQLVNF
ncbi:MAG: hemerythrin domain-containing protein [bacterium]|nr:hemerythrin domain-containing protein [bacterium]